MAKLIPLLCRLGVRLGVWGEWGRPDLSTQALVTAQADFKLSISTSFSGSHDHQIEYKIPKGHNCNLNSSLFFFSSN